MTTTEDFQRAIDEVITDGARRGLLQNIAQDEYLDGRQITVQGRSLVNFGSCSYLGLETHPAMRAGVIDAVNRYGTQFSSSRAYISAPAYERVEAELSELFGRPTLVASSTTMGHISALPTLLGSRDTLFLDHQVHHSVQTAATLARAAGTAVDLIPHNDLELLEHQVAAAGRHSRRVWYACDGLYSMYGNFAPVARLDELLARHPQLWLYVDDAHGFSWTGRHGRGYALEHLAPASLERVVVAGSLNKSFAAAGGALTFPTVELRRKVFTVGGPMIFSGPVQPPMLGAILASTELHRGPEVADRQAYLLELIRLFNQRATEAGIPLLSTSESPIRGIGVGMPHVAYNLVAKLRERGYFVDTATFPAVAAKRSGARITLTAHHSTDDIVNLIDALVDSLPDTLAEENASVSILERDFSRQLDGRAVHLIPRQRAPKEISGTGSHLRLERHVSIDAIDREDWDSLLGGRGAFDWEGLRSLEQVFTPGAALVDEGPEHHWSFSYLLVRDDSRDGRLVAATFFTTALWKDDMLSTAQLSAHVEGIRAERNDAYHLTSTMVAMGSLMSEGEHLWLDRTGDWRSAMRLILAAAREEEDASGAAGIVLRDLPDGDEELRVFLLGEGFVRIPLFATWEREVDFNGDDAFLAGLSRKARYHQRVNVLGWEGHYDVEVVKCGPTATMSTAELDHLHELYRNVHARNLQLNVFPLPRRVLEAVLHSPAWELIVLSLCDGGPGKPVAFACQHTGRDHVQPLFVGLDYRYVASHRSYQQLLLQAIRSGQRRGSRKVLFGMSADLQKSRFGAVAQKRWAYVQASDTFNSDLLAKLQESLAAPNRTTAG